MALKFDMSKGDWQRDYMMQQAQNEGINPYRELGQTMATGAGLLSKAAFPEGGRKIMKKLPNWFKRQGIKDVDAYKTDLEKWKEESKLVKGGIDWSIYDEELLKQPGAKMKILKKAGLRDRPMQTDFMGDEKYKFTPFQGMKNIGETILPEGGQKYKDIIAPKGGKNILRNLGYGVAGAGAATISPFLGGAAGLYGMANLQGPIKGAIAKEKARREAAGLEDIERQKVGRGIHQERLAQAQKEEEQQRIESESLRPSIPLSEDDEFGSDDDYLSYRMMQEDQPGGVSWDKYKTPEPGLQSFGDWEKPPPRPSKPILEEIAASEARKASKALEGPLPRALKNLDGISGFNPSAMYGRTPNPSKAISDRRNIKYGGGYGSAISNVNTSNLKPIDRFKKKGPSSGYSTEKNYKDYGFSSHDEMISGYKRAQQLFRYKGQELSMEQFLQYMEDNQGK